LTLATGAPAWHVPALRGAAGFQAVSRVRKSLQVCSSRFKKGGGVGFELKRSFFPSKRFISGAIVSGGEGGEKVFQG
jgi:hypothetical protein